MKTVFLASAIAAVLVTPAWADQALATSKACMSCHSVDKKLVGPAYKEVAAKYVKTNDAAAMLTQKIIKGSTGTWGPIPMPPNEQVSDEEARKLANWILSLK